MIRQAKQDDFQQLYEILNPEIVDIDIDTIASIYEETKKFIVWDEEGIKGLACIIISNKDEAEWKLYLYVQSQERRKGIGTLLYDEIQKYITDAKTIVTEFRVDIDNPTYFYKKIGYNKWYGSPELYYKGEAQPEVDIQFIQYEDKYYEQYAKCRQECFYEISVKNDFKSTPLSEKDRNYLFSLKDSIYVTLDDNKFVGAVTIQNGYLDHIMVSPSYQGKGYGKKITQFGINKELGEGRDTINLCYIEGNDKAENLYKSLGFKLRQNTHVYRKYI